MKLNVNERLIMVGVLPEKGTFKTMNTIQNLKDVLHLSEEEVVKFEFQQIDKAYTWNAEGVKKTEVAVSELGFDLVMESFETLDKDATMNIQQFSVFKYLKEVKEEMDNSKEKAKPKDKK